MILDRIVEKTRERVAERKKTCPLDELRTRANEQLTEWAFLFEQALQAEEMTFICEVKKASPSKGVIAEDFPYEQIAREYEAAGAGAISVLTEPYFFLGQDEHLREIKQAVHIPVLRKDFVVDEYMIYEGKLLGADAILLICAILTPEQLNRYFKLADSLGMAVLVEAHDEREVERALESGARIIGVNNRDLRDFTVDLDNSLRLRKSIPEGVLMVSESGIQTAADIRRLKSAGIDGVLIGETLMKSPDKGKALERLRS